jgi:predicted ATPase
MDLPRSYTPFVGRARELADIARALSQSRLVTLTGLGGCGKTRMELESAK